MKYFIFLFMSCNAGAATQMSDCGDYDIYGEFKKNETTKYLELLVNSGSVSEYKFQLTEEEERQAVAYIGHSVKVRAKLLSKVPDYHGSIAKLGNIDFSVPDKANLSGMNGFVLVKKEKCR